MARKAKTKGTISGYFRQVFDERPEWLRQKSNNEILARYRADHGMAEDQELPKSVRNTLANLKSVLRKKHRIKVRKAARKAGQKGSPDRAVAAAPRPGRRTMEALEEQIDDCMTLAWNLDREGLHDVIRHLRAARREVVWKMGQP